MNKALLRPVLLEAAERLRVLPFAELLSRCSLSPQVSSVVLNDVAYRIETNFWHNSEFETDSLSGDRLIVVELTAYESEKGHKLLARSAVVTFDVYETGGAEPVVWVPVFP